MDPGDSGIAIGCVFRMSPNKLERDELQVQRIEQLDCSLTLGPGEELISNIIEIRPSGNVDDERLVSQVSFIFQSCTFDRMCSKKTVCV